MHQTFRKTINMPWGVDLPKEMADEAMREIMADFENCLKHGFIDQRYEFRDGMDIPAHTGLYLAPTIDRIDVDYFTFESSTGPWHCHALKMVVEFTPTEESLAPVLPP